MYKKIVYFFKIVENYYNWQYIIVVINNVAQYFTRARKKYDLYSI